MSDRIPASPADTLRQTLQEAGITQAELARRMGCTRAYINEIATGGRRINAAVALRLEAHLGFPASLWLVIQSDYDLAIERMKQRTGVAR